MVNWIQRESEGGVMKRLGVFLVVVAVLSISVGADQCVVYDYGGERHPWEERERYENTKFSVQIPKGWMRKTDTLPYRTEEGSVVGVQVYGPTGEYEIRAKMLFAYYQNGGMVKDYRGYVSLRTNSFVRIDPLKEIAVKPTEIDGKKGVMFEMETFELVHENSLRPIKPEPGTVWEMGPYPQTERLAPSVKVEIVNTEAVIPMKRGFFVARFDMPKTLSAECAAMIESILASIRLDE
jgi:hypothetical protein